MDRQLVKDVDEKVAQYYTFSSALVSDEQRHPAWQRFCVRFGVLENIGKMIEWLKIEPEEYEEVGK